MFYNSKDNIEIEKEDQCYTCNHFNDQKLCPLLEALSCGVVEFEEDLIVKNCSWYAKRDRHLKII